MTAIRTRCVFWCLPALLLRASWSLAQSVDVSPLRTIQPLNEQWKFLRNDELTDDAALAAAATDWQLVTLPHSWNAVDAASVDLPGSYDRGVGWYRLEFAAPPVGARHWLEIGAASLVADVWLNGQRLGQHKGGFTAFRFDVTDALVTGVPNVLLVKVDNSQPRDAADLTAIAPLGGDFNVSGGLDRHVALISTVAGVHFDLGDSGGPGVYASSNVAADGTATVAVRTKLRNAGSSPTGAIVRVSLVDATGVTASTAEHGVEMPLGQTAEVALELPVSSARLWRGTTDPYLYRLVADLVAADGTAQDRVVQNFGIRSMRFDPNEGFFLNGEPLRLRGVAIHQDFQGRGWAVTDADVETSLALIQEIGANAVRLGHYPFGDYTLQRLDELGIVAWAETAVGLGTSVESCSQSDATSDYVANAQQQLTELILQQFNRAAVGLWAVGNESSARQLQCDDPYDNVSPVIGALHETAKALDPSRPTAYAEFDENLGRPALPFSMAGITDLLGTNRYYWWYDLAVEELQPLLDQIHASYPNQPLAISEYGAGAALTHHTDNPLGGPPEVRSADEGEVTYQPEEYAAYVHEQVYRVISTTPYLWGSFVWNMFDFGSAHRNEGDVLGVNTKGLVTFDRQTRKDPFYFYKANWSSEPTTYIVGRRYTERAYGVADVKVYSNADSVDLAVNGAPFAALTADRCEQKTCVFEDVPLALGANTLTATGNHAGTAVTDSVQWSLPASDVNIAAGRLTTGYVSTGGLRFGSDDFFNGGAAGSIDPGDVDGGTLPVAGTEDDALYKFFRRGTFDYEIPLPDGSYELTLGFIEPDEDAAAGDNVFGVTANGQSLLRNFDVLREASTARSVVQESFQIAVSGGGLSLAFVPVTGDALVSSIAVKPR